MGEMPHKNGFVSATSVDANFCLMRNAYLNLFAELETALFQVAKKAQCDLSETAPLHQRLENLAKNAKPSNHLSKANADKLKDVAGAIDRHLRIRNVIVHSVMTPGSNGQSDAAIFQNAADRSAAHPFYLVLTADDFAKQFALLKGFIRCCEQLLNPPSSPPRP